MFDHRRQNLEWPDDGAAVSSISISSILSAARRQIAILLFCLIVSIFAGAFYLIQAVPKYTSQVSLLIDSQNAALASANPLENTLTFDGGSVDSQVQVIQSDKIAGMVVKQLGLQNNTSFLRPPQSLLGRGGSYTVSGLRWVYSVISGSPALPEIEDLPEAARINLCVEKLQSNLITQRVGRTYVLQIAYQDENPGLAQTIAGQFANAYLQDQLESKYDANRRAAGWMENYIRDLKSRSFAADAAVQRYRADHNLTEASGRLIDDQSLTDATTQLTAAKDALDTASAKYLRLKEIVDSKDTKASVTGAMDDPNVAQLRQKYFDAAKRADEFNVKYGPDHQATLNARKDMTQYQTLIFSQLTNLLQTYQSDVAIAQSKVNSIQSNIDGLRQRSVANSEAMVKLSALQQDADTLKALYTGSLQRLQESQQQQSFPVTDARIIASASEPLFPSSPKKVLALIASLLMGAIAGSAFAAYREWRDRGFRTGSQVRDELGLPFIANVPRLPITIAKKPVAQVLSAFPREGNSDRTRKLRASNAIMDNVLLEPFSQFAEAMRRIRTSISMSFTEGRNTTIGFISLYPNEGKSTISKNFGTAAALQGESVLLIDGDLRNPSLTRDLIGAAPNGLADVVNGMVEIRDVLFNEEKSGMTFIPAAVKGGGLEANELLGNQRTRDFVRKLQDHNDLLVIDFPPVGLLIDAASAISVVDGYVLVVEWGKTPRSLVKEFLLNNPQIAAKVLGVVLNKVDMKALQYYNDGSVYASGNYDKYYSPATSRSNESATM